jgi:N-acyl homoserine lactone hydrolase
MKKIALVVLLALCALLWTFTPSPLKPIPQLAATLPEATPPAGMSLSALPTGVMHSKAALAYRGGSILEARDFAMTAILVKHPKGNLLFDTGLGQQVDEQVKTLPKLMQATTTYTKGVPAAIQLAAAKQNVDGIVLTHAHWDHVSGFDSLKNIPIWISAPEQAFIASDHEAAALAHSFGKLNYRLYGFDDGPYLGFASSYDVWSDGSVVLVPSPGHTPGSVIAFITLPSGARYALLGDLVWQKEGIDLPAERPWIARYLIGEDSAKVRESILHMAALQKAFPEMKLLPAHDARVMATLPVFPAVKE